MSERAQTTYRFLSGAEMEPLAVRAAHPGARFVARARIAVADATVAPAFADHVGDEIWGILIGVPDDAGGAAQRETVTDDGRTFAAALAGDALIGGDPDEALAAVRYWELPPAYVALLKAALAATDEDPSDGN